MNDRTAKPLPRWGLPLVGVLLAGLVAWGVASANEPYVSTSPTASGCPAAPTVTANPDAYPECWSQYGISPDPAPEPEPTPTYAPEESHGEYAATCDYVLDFDAGHEFVATAFVTNETSSNLTIETTATWRQAGHKPIAKTRTDVLPAHAEDYEITLARPASDKQIGRIQALDTDQQCDVEVTYVGVSFA